MIRKAAGSTPRAVHGHTCSDVQYTGSRWHQAEVTQLQRPGWCSGGQCGQREVHPGGVPHPRRRWPAPAGQRARLRQDGGACRRIRPITHEPGHQSQMYKATSLHQERNGLWGYAFAGIMDNPHPPPLLPLVLSAQEWQASCMHGWVHAVPCGASELVTAGTHAMCCGRFLGTSMR